MHNNFPIFFVFLDQYDNQIFKNNNTNIGIVYRNYNTIKRETELIKIAKACKKKRYQLFVSNDIKLAIKVKADGIYIPAFNRTNNFNNIEKRNFKIVGSAHNHKEISEKISQKCAVIFLSPAFYVKKRKYYLDTYKFNFLTLFKKKNFFALGGINEYNLKKIKLLNVKGLGGISLYKKKPAYKRPVFLKNKSFNF